MSHPIRLRKAVILAAALVLFLSFAILSPAAADGAEMKKADKANYELAARFTSAKVGKLVFDTSVQAHWLETGDRFWYSWETGKGRSFSIVDPLRATKSPLFDNARMAALLTGIVLTPYDSQHLPFKTVKFIAKDTALRLEL
ncbi:MAG: S9 family peptidase, partial [Candidatus Aminicenantales bacterium]